MTVPWYQTFFKTQNIALAMGALVLTFGGLLGFLVLQDRNTDTGSAISQVNEEQQPGGPYYSKDSAITSANIAAGNMNTAADAPSNSTANMRVSSTSLSANKIQKPVEKNQFGLPGEVSPESVIISGEADKPKTETMAAAAPAPPPPPAAVSIDGAGTELTVNKTDDDRKDENREPQLAKRKQSENVRSRKLRDAPAKGGPTRAAQLPTQTRQSGTSVFDMVVTRSVSGKAFNNRNNVWYDSAYKNQATLNFRRGTDEYKKLDGGLRNIADTLGGTVVVVWKSKAYRIQ